MFRTRSKHKLALRFFDRPILPFALELLVLTPLVLATDPLAAAGGYLFVLPWVALLFAVVNLPFVGAAFKAFRMDDATRRNHALEHATIHYLRQKGARRLSGEAARSGFQISGRTSIAEIRSAFQHVRRVVRDGGQLPYVSRRCGSNIVTALGLGLLLLLVVTLGSVVLRPPLPVRASALAAVVLLFIGMRHGIGNAIQRRFFMKVDFDDISLRDVRQIQTGGMDQGPVHFVETIIRARLHDAV